VTETGQHSLTGGEAPEGMPEPTGHLDVDALAEAWEIAAVLERLPVVQREVLLLAYRDDLSQSQIAEVLGVPLGTVKSRTYHALRGMAALLAPITPIALDQAAPAARMSGGRR